MTEVLYKNQCKEGKLKRDAGIINETPLPLKFAYMAL